MATTDFDDLELDGVDINEAMAAVDLQPEFVDPVNGVFIIRPGDISMRTVTNEDDEEVRMASMAYQIIAIDAETEGWRKMGDMVNALLGESFRLAGNGIKDTEKMSAKDQKRLGLEQFKTRLVRLCPDSMATATTPALVGHLLSHYGPEEKRAMRVKIRVRSKDGYTNITGIRVLDPEVDLGELDGFDLDGYKPWVPSVRKDD